MRSSSDDEIRKILTEAKTIAVIGCSEKPWRTSNHIAGLMQDKGYTMIPVNPEYSRILSETCYSDINDVPVSTNIDIAVIFRNRRYARDAVESVIKRVNVTESPIVVWTQLGVSSREAMKMAQKTGLTYIKNRCIAVEWDRLVRD